jgi:CHAT domain-containing protein
VRELRAAIGEMERSGRSLRLAERRSAFQADKWDVYVQLALLERERNRPGSAFEASERLRAREMLELLARGRIGASSDTAAALLARAQDLQRRMSELIRGSEGILAGPVALRGPTDPPGDGPRREALTRAQDAYAAVLLDMRDGAPAQATLLSGETASWQDVARRLRSEEVFVEYLLSDSASLAFVVRRDTLAVLELEVGRRDLARLVELARGTLEGGNSVRGDSLWRSPLRRLHEHLIAPVEASGLLAGARRLILVPHAELHYLPFAALLDPGSRKYLVERFELAQAPSASVWLALGDRRRGRASEGALALAPRPDALPASLAEVRTIARLAGSGTTLLTGAAASEAAFRREAPSRRVLHLATYGVLNKQNPLFSYVDFAADATHDGRLEVHEVFGLALTADLVVLSACQTGLGSGALADVPAGDDWVSLSRAFLHAGAARVVATLWSVEDQATALIMEKFYQGLAAGVDEESALAQAQRALVRSPATAHPFYWAGIVVVGGAR